MSQEYIEISEKNLQDAITTACQKLSVTSDRLDYIVVDPGKTGFLGFNSRPAVIKARVKEAADETQKVLNDVLSKADKKVQMNKADANQAKDKAQNPEKKQKKKVEKTQENESAQKSVLERDSVQSESVKKSVPEFIANEDTKKVDESAGVDAESNAEEKSAYREERPEYKKRRNRRRKPRTDRTDFSSENGKRMDVKPEYEDSHLAGADVRPVKRHQERPQLTDEQIDEIKAKANKFLTDVFQAMDMEAAIEMDYDKENAVLSLEFSGEDMGVLIGKRGQTLDSLQYLVSLVINKGIDGYIHVKADTENYRERRKKTLENLARNISSKVKRTGRSVRLEPMNPYERRIIHSALQNDRYVTTYSEGEEPYRRVVVVLKK